MEAGKSWQLITEENEHGELVLTLPQELLDEVGWKPGDNLEWIDQGDGAWEIRQKPTPSEHEDF